MKKNRAFLLLIINSLVFLHAIAYSQKSDLVQLSGLVVTELGEEPYPLAFAEIRIAGTTRGVYANEKGYFSIAAERGDTLIFRYIGFKEAAFLIPLDLIEDHYTIFQILTKDEILLPETVVYPWPSKEHFKQEFLAMDVKDKMRETAENNLAQETLRKMLDYVQTDGRANSSFYLDQNARQYYHFGQFRPMPILSPTAWIEFFKAWKRGDFKIKKEKYE